MTIKKLWTMWPQPALLLVFRHDEMTVLQFIWNVKVVWSNHGRNFMQDIRPLF